MNDIFGESFDFNEMAEDILNQEKERKSTKFFEIKDWTSFTREGELIVRIPEFGIQMEFTPIEEVSPEVYSYDGYVCVLFVEKDMRWVEAGIAVSPQDIEYEYLDEDEVETVLGAHFRRLKRETICDRIMTHAGI